jgi:cell division protein FtsB
MDQLTQETERFKELLGVVVEEVETLRQQIKDLKKENAKLVTKIEDLQGEQTDIFSAISESERLALRQHVQGLITKIDNHLNNQA